ncbi:uncharacterized protein LOC144785699 [Lissotriton helveticus]
MERQRVTSLWGQLILTVVSTALFISAPQGSVRGAVNQSVLLPVSYRINESLNVQLLITWTHKDSNVPIIAYKLNNVSLGEDGRPLSCNGSLFTHDTYKDRVIFHPETASLRLLNLQLSDSGVYTVSFRDIRHSRDISLSVSSTQESPGNDTAAKRPPDGDPGKGQSLVMLVGSATGGCSAFILLLLALYCALRPKQKRIIQEEQVQSLEYQLQEQGQEYQLQEQGLNYQLHRMDRTRHEDPALTYVLPTIYSLLGEDHGSRLSMPEPAIIYTQLNHHPRPAFSTSTL